MRRGGESRQGVRASMFPVEAQADSSPNARRCTDPHCHPSGLTPSPRVGYARRPVRSFVDRVAAITGAASGIGRALALELAAERCHLELSDVDEAGLAETARLAGEHGIRVTTARVDVA